MVKAGLPLDALLGWMECLSDPTRLRLLRLLERHELGVVDLCNVVQLPQSTVSRHLKLLADQGFVNARRQATTRLYRTRLDELEPPARRLWLLAREQTETWATVHQDEMRLTRRLRQRQTEAQNFFAGAARQWDKLRAELYGQSFTQSALLALLPPEYVIADLGCGSAQVSATLAPHVRQVIAVDNSPAMLKAARRRIAQFPNVSLRRGDLSSLPIDDRSCDAALMLLVLSYLSEPAVALKEMSRILKPTGRAVIVDLLPHDRDDFRRQMGQHHAGFSSETLMARLTAAGFASVKIESLTSDPSAKGPALFQASAVRQ